MMVPSVVPGRVLTVEARDDMVYLAQQQRGTVAPMERLTLDVRDVPALRDALARFTP